MNKSYFIARVKQWFRGDWRKIAKRAWSFRIAAFWGVFNGALLGLAAFSEILSAQWFLALNMFGYGMIAVARLIKQPGADL